jgi:hypothetical protein
VRHSTKHKRTLNANKKCHKQILKLTDVVVGNGPLKLNNKCLSLNYIRNNIVVCNRGDTDLDAIKHTPGIHPLRIRDRDLWVSDTVNASLGLRFNAPNGDKSPVFIRLPREESIKIRNNGHDLCSAMRTCALTQPQSLPRGKKTVYSQKMVISIAA